MKKKNVKIIFESPHRAQTEFNWSKSGWNRERRRNTVSYPLKEMKPLRDTFRQD